MPLDRQPGRIEPVDVPKRRAHGAELGEPYGAHDMEGDDPSDRVHPQVSAADARNDENREQRQRRYHRHDVARASIQSPPTAKMKQRYAAA